MKSMSLYEDHIFVFEIVSPYVSYTCHYCFQFLCGHLSAACPVTTTVIVAIQLRY